MLQDLQQPEPDMRRQIPGHAGGDGLAGRLPFNLGPRPGRAPANGLVLGRRLLPVTDLRRRESGQIIGQYRVVQDPPVSGGALDGGRAPAQFGQQGLDIDCPTRDGNAQQQGKCFHRPVSVQSSVQGARSGRLIQRLAPGSSTKSQVSGFQRSGRFSQ